MSRYLGCGTKVYVAGPMRGYKDYNFPMFDRVSELLDTERGWFVSSPAQMDRDNGFDETAALFTGADFENAMRRDIRVITEMDAMVLLPGWEMSSGVAKELFVAEAIGLDIYEYNEFGCDWWLTPKLYDRPTVTATIDGEVLEGE